MCSWEDRKVGSMVNNIELTKTNLWFLFSGVGLGPAVWCECVCIRERCVTSSVCREGGGWIISGYLTGMLSTISTISTISTLSRGTRNSQMCFQSGLRTADKEAPSHTWPPPDTILPWDLVPGFYFIRRQDSCEDTLVYLQFVNINIWKYLFYYTVLECLLFPLTLTNGLRWMRWG